MLDIEEELDNVNVQLELILSDIEKQRAIMDSAQFKLEQLRNRRDDLLKKKLNLSRKLVG